MLFSFVRTAPAAGLLFRCLLRAEEATSGAAPVSVEDSAKRDSPASSPPEESHLDRLQRRFEDGLDGSARWFDGFLGEERYREDGGQTYTRVAHGVPWKNREGFEPRGRFRVRFCPTNTSNWLNAVIGRDEPNGAWDDSHSDRQQMFRGWFFGSAQVGARWPRESSDENRKLRSTSDLGLRSSSVSRSRREFFSLPPRRPDGVRSRRSP
jgi:hypothetical protein